MPHENFCTRSFKAVAGLSLALVFLAGCANSASRSPYARHHDPAIKSQLQAATERYFACVYRAVDNNIRYAPVDDNRTVMQVAVEDCRGALRNLRLDVARLNIKSSVAKGLVDSAQRESYAIAREGLRRYFEKTQPTRLPAG